MIAFFVAVLIALALPKRVECGWPGGSCERIVDRRSCRSYEIEPLGFFLLETVFDRDIGFAYSSGDDC